MFWKRKVRSMVLEAEAKPAIVDPTADQIASILADLRGNGPSSYASLTDELGSYVQVAGGRPWCMVEWRKKKPLVHSRAYKLEGRQPYVDGATINFSAGSIPLRADEWLLLKQATEIFTAFLQREPFPEFVRWRPINSLLGLEDNA